MFKVKDYSKNWYVRVTDENKEVLSKWRFGENSYKLNPGYVTGMCLWDDGGLSKEQNPYSQRKGRTFDFGEEITFEEFKKYILKEQVESIFKNDDLKMQEPVIIAKNKKKKKLIII